MNQLIRVPDGGTERLRGRILAVTTASYVGCFAVWTIFAIIGVEIQRKSGSAITKLVAPWVMIAWSWQGVARLWALLLLVMAAVFWLGSTVVREQVSRRASRQPVAPLSRQVEPLRRLQVWRFGLYYFFTFGGYVALSVWLPYYLVAVYGLDIRMAGAIAIAFSLPAGLLRVLGGVLSDRYDARWVSGELRFTIATGLPVFIPTLIALGLFMGLGKAAVFKHIPAYYPDQVGAVGGAVGAIGGLGGFVLPLAFGVANDLVDVWTSCFMLLFGLASVSLWWMHFAIRRQEWASAPQLQRLRFLPELGLHANEGGVERTERDH